MKSQEVVVLIFVRFGTRKMLFFSIFFFLYIMVVLGLSLWPLLCEFGDAVGDVGGFALYKWLFSGV